MSCSNSNDCGCGPCDDQIRPVNAAAETLPSTIDNLVLNFYGSVTKAVVDGKVVWTLPCNLATGLNGNPRRAGEGTACYFLRLFEDGITGLQGPTGATGAPGTNGVNSFTTVSVNFAAPTLASPSVTFSVASSSGIAPGAVYFVQSLGWIQVVATASGSVTANLIALISAPSATVLVGALVSPAGAQGPTGKAAWTTTRASFVPPAIAGTVNIPLTDVSPFAAGLFVFVETSGYYLITSVGTTSIVAQFKQAVSGPANPVASGSKVVPTGPVP